MKLRHLHLLLAALLVFSAPAMALVVDSLSALGKAFAGADFAKVPHDVFGDSRNGRLEIGAETFCLEASVCGLLTADQVGPDVP